MADTNLLVLAREYKKLREEVKKVLSMPKGDKGDQGEKGEKGDKGDTGPQGFPGRDGKDGINGYDGKDGRDGVDGKDGKDGLDGVGVQNAYIDFDSSLVIVLTSGQEINAGFLSQETKDAVVATFKQGAQTLNELLPSQEGNSGKYLTTDGTNVSWATVASGTVTSVAMTTPTGLSVSGSPITTTGTLALSMTAGYSIPTTASQTNWDSAYSERRQWDGGSTNLVAPTGRTSLGATTLGSNLFTITNPGAITFPRFNADNTVSSLDAATFRTAIGAGTGNGTVTSVGATSPVASSGGTTPTISLSSGYGDTQNPYASKTANFFLAAPNGSAGAPTFRAIVAADVPTLNQNTTGTASNVTGTVAVANGGTGQTTASAAFNALSPVTTTGDLIIGNGTNSATRLPIGANTYVLTSNGTTASWAAPSGGGSGTVTSVAATVPSFLSVSGSPITTSGTLAISLASTPSNGQLLIGNGTGFSYATLTAGSNITITNSAGGITIASTGGGGSGTVTSVDVSGGTTGLTTSGGPVTTSGVITLAGTLAIANGGTGQTTQTAAFDALAPTTSKGDLIAHNGTDNVRVAAGTNGYVLTADSSAAAGVAWVAASGGTASADIQEFTSTGTSTWTKPAGAKLVYVLMFGGGGGGGSGRRRALASSGTAAFGGGGGGAGGRSELWIPASALGSTETVTVGAGATGGAAQTVDDTNGNNATGGGNSSFGSWGLARAGGNGSGGSAIGGTNGTGGGGGTDGISTAGTSYSSSGGAGGSTGGTNGIRGGYRGGGGGGASGFAPGSTTAVSGLIGGKGGSAYENTTSTSGGGGTAGSTNGNGGNGNDATTYFVGGDGGGGGGSGTTTAGAGGNGGYPGGGGGGGGVGHGVNSGAGGNGGNGYVRVVTFF